MKRDAAMRTVGPYRKPTPGEVRAVRAALTADPDAELSPIDYPHRAKSFDFRNDPPALRALRSNPEAAASLSGCGHTGTLVALPYGDHPVPVCIHCDGVHLMPNYKASDA